MKKFVFIGFAVLFCVSASGAFAFFKHQEEKAPHVVEEAPTFTPAVISASPETTLPLAATPSASLSPSATPSAVPKATLSPKKKVLGLETDTDTPNKNKDDLESALLTKYGDGAKYSIDQNTGTFAQGTVISGKKNKWWLAAKSAPKGWKVVVDGTSYVYCNDIRGYKFPSSIVPACWDKKKNSLINL
jgi:hypothetical protein